MGEEEGGRVKVREEEGGEGEGGGEGGRGREGEEEGGGLTSVCSTSSEL